MKSFIRTFAILLAATVILAGCGGKNKPAAPAAPADTVQAPQAISTLVKTEVGGMYFGTMDSQSPDNWTKYRDQQQLLSAEKAVIIAELKEKAKAEQVEVTLDNKYIENEAKARLIAVRTVDNQGNVVCEDGLCKGEAFIDLKSKSVRSDIHVTFSLPKEEPKPEAKEGEKAPATSTDASTPAQPAEKKQRDLTMVISTSQTKEVDGKSVTEWVAFRTYKFDADSTVFALENTSQVNGEAKELHNVTITVVGDAITGVITERADAEKSEVSMERRLSLTSYVAPLSKEELAKKEAADKAAKEAADKAAKEAADKAAKEAAPAPAGEKQGS